MADIAIMSMLSESTAIVSVNGVYFLAQVSLPARKLTFTGITVICQKHLISASD